MRIRALIVDDEELARENLKMMIESFCPSIEIISTAENKNDAKNKISTLKPEVVFLDICMPSGTEGLTLLDEIENKDFLVVFVTAFKEYALKAFNANAVHYLLKPIDIDELIEAEKKIEERLSLLNSNPETKIDYQKTLENTAQSIRTKSNKKLTISHSRGIKIIDQADIEYIEAKGNCTDIFFKDKTRYTDTRTLKVYENLLNPNQFFRTHKSYIINLNYLKEYLTSLGNVALLTSGKEIPVSRNKTKEFTTLLKNL
ncbi:MAG: two-component system LytT family response regulator [Urechidicola sp.]|jgi:two-component system LytT family response regulator|tara:strand:+ start:9473 stop:10246 length:774 start_codon:yes stop_codon:yes gene_type:complete